MMNAAKTIATHSGTFHADESLAVFMLKQLPEYKNAKVIRTRDLELIKQADIAVDVGAIYDPSTHRYDHHQRGFEETFSKEYKIKLSSAGLVYKHFGKKIIQSILKCEETKVLSFIYQKVYDDLILMFDGVDNGVDQYPEEVKPNYSDPTCISSRVGRLNPSWNKPTSDEIMLVQFLKAVEITGEELVSKVENIFYSWFPAREIVDKAMKERFKVHDSGKILLIDRYCPWSSHLDDLENELGLKAEEKPIYCLFEDTSGAWRIQAIPKEPGSFHSRKALPEPWRGVRDQELSTLTGVEGCIFIHAAGFIGGAKTKDAVLKLAKMAIDFY